MASPAVAPLTRKLLAALKSIFLNLLNGRLLKKVKRVLKKLVTKNINTHIYKVPDKD